MNRELSTAAPDAVVREYRHLTGTARAAVLLAIVCLGTASLAYGNNPGDPLYCQPNEGTTFLIVNGGAGVFTSDSDCYNNNYANNTDTTIATSQGGTMARTAGTGNYTYTPPTPGFTGLDTFPIHVNTCWNGAGGTCSSAGTSAPGGAANLTVTLNVIPAATTLAASGATLVPIPAGSVTNCTAGGNSDAGPAAGAVLGCITAISTAANPSHGALTVSGNALKYTPTAGYSGPDSFQYYALGINTDGNTSLNSGAVTVAVTVSAAPVPTLGVWALIFLSGALLLYGMMAITRQTA